MAPLLIYISSVHVALYDLETNTAVDRVHIKIAACTSYILYQVCVQPYVDLYTNNAMHIDLLKIGFMTVFLKVFFNGSPIRYPTFVNTVRIKRDTSDFETSRNRCSIN